MSTIEKIKELKAVCAECGLDDDGLLAKYTDEELAATHNGIGPEAFPAWLRSVIDALHPSLEAVALIHDVERDEPVAEGDQVGRTRKMHPRRRRRVG